MTDKTEKNKECYPSHRWFYLDDQKLRVCMTCHKWDPPEIHLGKHVPSEWSNDR
ncbi:hypothetical protein [Nitrosopumilus sp.]|uniref:hypothetical protein n=1 Tax=Nitrosopumilus sp. TaxID=2024843 RepID=UPI002931C575|nr:hypothetical protein [Nitrosopumilus sp.]